MEFLLGFVIGSLIMFVIYRNRIKTLEDALYRAELRLKLHKRNSENWRNEYYKK